MSNRPFRFVHAADFYLDRPVCGVSEVPDHLRELFLEAGYRAAQRVFELVVSDKADFLVLSGDLFDPRTAGPRGTLFLAEQFDRLAEHDVPVYWAGRRFDPRDAWPSFVPLPGNVHIFPSEDAEEFVFEQDDKPRVRLVGLSRCRSRMIKPAAFALDRSGLFSIAVANGTAEPEALKASSIKYWALGGEPRRTLFEKPHAAHYPGSPQGKDPHQIGPHGATRVQVDALGHVRLTLTTTDVMRWHVERVLVDEQTTREKLRSTFDQRVRSLMKTIPSTDLMISWTLAGEGRLMSRLRRDGLAEELLSELRASHGFGPPVAWSVSLSIEPPSKMPEKWYEQESLQGDFLRQIRHLQTNASESLELETYLPEKPLDGTQAAALIDDTRQRVLCEAAAMGIDLLSGEEPES